jgi:rubrerythrin
MDPSQVKTFEDIIQFAIGEEEKAASLYRDLAGKSDRSPSREMFLELAEQEDAHKAKLENRGVAGLPGGGSAEIPDLKLSSYLVDVKITPESSYQDILIFAIKGEESAVRLYTTLGNHAGDDAAKELFASLANEEKAHKLKLETEYDEYVLKEN